MENVSRMMMIGFSVAVFAAALAVIIIMYADIDTFIDLIEKHSYYRSVMAGE